MAQSRCNETLTLLHDRHAALLKTQHQMEVECQSMVNLTEVLGGTDEDLTSPISAPWSTSTPNSSSSALVPRTQTMRSSVPSLSRCSSLDTDEESSYSSEFLMTKTPTSSKVPLESKNSSLGGIKEVRESTEDVCGSRAFMRESNHFLRAAATECLNSTSNNVVVRAFSSGSSSCSSSEDSSATPDKLFVNKIQHSWRDDSIRSTEESTEYVKWEMSAVFLNLKIKFIFAVYLTNRLHLR